eukprot:TRINITY_DN51778_c0_g1_i1.p1 TRINITY_DN51778_c0_g1~~TRINITY_DN51778_c0_g1_i1.p1  ORF type:complete len:387 (+),score=23.40 TRINITY_DN51778_c0_g1_i1:76-1161(+)
MPLQGRSRDTVPQKWNRKPKKYVPPDTDTSPAMIAAKANAAAKAICRARLSSDVEGKRDIPLPLAGELWLRMKTFAGVKELCRAETVSRTFRLFLIEHEASLWEPFCKCDFPSMWSSLRGSSSPSQLPCHKTSAYMSPISLPSPLQSESAASGYVDCFTLPPATLQDDEGSSPAAMEWKLCYARRTLKQRAWDAARGRTRTQSSASESSNAPVGNARICASCGERFGGTEVTECLHHLGEFLPRASQPGRSLDHLDDVAPAAAWSRPEVAQLQTLVRAAWRSAGGSTGVRNNARNFRGGGHWAKYMGFKGWGSRGHWAEGCGPRPGSSLVRDCIDGKVPCAWTCCGSEELISEGCQAGAHR